MRILVLSHPPDVPSVKYRVLQLIPLLLQSGIEIERVDLPEGWLDRLRVFRRAAEFDAVVLQKRLFASWQLGWLRRKAKRLIYDFDDPMIYSRKDGQVRTSSSRVSRFRKVMKTADSVVVNSAPLAQMAREHGAKRVEIIPTSVDLGRWIPKPGPGDGSIIGWVGSPANLPNLLDIAPALEGRTLRIVTDESLRIPGVKVEFVRWEFATEPANVQSFDVAIAPLPNDIWSRGKMPFKVLYYWAAGLPVVASRVGAIESVLEHGKTGFLASTMDEWKDALQILVRNPDLRMKMGRAGLELVQREFTVEVAAAKWKALLQA